MKLLRYVKDRLAALAIAACTLVFVAVILVVYGLDAGVTFFIVLVEMVALIGSFAYDYLRRRRFYDEFAAVCESLDRKHFVCEVIDRPAFLEGELSYDALLGAAKSMNDEISATQRASEEYRDYIEMWVHEVKTPIAAAELAVANDVTPSADRIARELDRIENCVEQALYYARGTTLRNDYLIRKTGLEQLVKEAVRNRSRVLIDAGVQPSFVDLDEWVFADVKWCTFVLCQIIDNAAKYAAPAAQAVCSAKQPVACATGSTEGRCLTFSALRLDRETADERVVLTIADNGIGMPSADVARAFDRAFTGENGRARGKSTGMGLYLCKRLSDKMGLGLSLDSEEGVGTRLYLTFPENRMYLP